MKNEIENLLIQLTEEQVNKWTKKFGYSSVQYLKNASWDSSWETRLLLRKIGPIENASGLPDSDVISIAGEENIIKKLKEIINYE